MAKSFAQFGTRLSDLEEAWKDRLRDARALLHKNRFAAAIAAGVYAIEIRLKVLICQRLDLLELPRVSEFHDLEELLIAAGLSRRIQVSRPRQGPGKLGLDPDPGGESERAALSP